MIRPQDLVYRDSLCRMEAAKNQSIAQKCLVGFDRAIIVKVLGISYFHSTAEGVAFK